MKRNILFLLLITLFVIPACKAKDYMQTCINKNEEKIAKAFKEIFKQSELYTFAQEAINSNNEVTLTSSDKQRVEFAISKIVLSECLEDMPNFLQYDAGKEKTVSANINAITELDSGENVNVSITELNVDGILKSLRSPVAIVVWPKDFLDSNYKQSLHVISSEHNKLKTFWYPASCSEHDTTIVSDTNPFNVAAKSTFTEWKNADVIQIDQPKSVYTLAFPGSIIIHLKNSADTQMVYYTDIVTAYQKATDLANKLAASNTCNNLDIYIVGLKSEKINDKLKLIAAQGESYSSGDFGDTISYSGGILSTGLLIAGGITAFFVPPVGIGLLIGGGAVGAGTAGFQAVHDYDINETINEVVVLSNPIPVN